MIASVAPAETTALPEQLRSDKAAAGRGEPLLACENSGPRSGHARCAALSERSCLPECSVAPVVAPQAGELCVERVDGASAVVGAVAGDPLKLVVSRARGVAAWVWVATYGGGLLAGDRVQLDVHVGADSAVVLATQATTKIYRSEDGRSAEQIVRVRIAAGGLMAWIGDPVCPFADSRFAATTSVELAPGAGLVWLEGVTAGRLARGERWAFKDYRSCLRVDRDGVPLLREALALQPPVPALRDWGALATLVVMGDPLAAWAQDELQALNSTPAEPSRELVVAATPLPRGPGMLVRVAARRWELVDQWLAEHLRPLAALVGGAPWERRP